MICSISTIGRSQPVSHPSSGSQEYYIGTMPAQILVFIIISPLSDRFPHFKTGFSSCILSWRKDFDFSSFFVFPSSLNFVLTACGGDRLDSRLYYYVFQTRIRSFVVVRKGSIRSGRRRKKQFFRWLPHLIAKLVFSPSRLVLACMQRSLEKVVIIDRSVSLSVRLVSSLNRSFSSELFKRIKTSHLISIDERSRRWFVRFFCCSQNPTFPNPGESL